MAFSIAQIIQVAAPAAILAIHRPYTLSEVRELSNAPGYYCCMRDRVTGTQVPIVWSHNEEVRADTERKRVDLVHALLTNAINALDFALEYRDKPRYNDAVYDVDFSED